MQQSPTRMTVILSVAFALLVVLSACAVGRGTVLTKISDRQAEVRFRSNGVAVGDRVALFEEDCELSEESHDDSTVFPTCRKGKKIAEGEVIRMLNERDSVVQVDQDVDFEEGFFVERQQLVGPQSPAPKEWSRIR